MSRQTPICVEPADKQRRRLAREYWVLGCEMRLHILEILLRTDSEPCVEEITIELGISQPTVSYHLRQLADVGFVAHTQHGLQRHYRVDRARLDDVGVLWRRFYTR